MKLIRMDRAREATPFVLNIVKDFSWCSTIGALSVITIVPVLTFQVYEIWKCRREGTHKLFQNVAASLALSANGLWMIGDLYAGEKFRHIAKWVFVLGLLFAAAYTFLLFNRKKDSAPQRVMAITRESRGLLFIHSTVNAPAPGSLLGQVRKAQQRRNVVVRHRHRPTQ